ncbi:MAG: acetyl-CoA acetyltransferase [Acidimicrobiales bacterium]
MTIDPRTPVIVGASEISARTADAEPIALMIEVAEQALSGNSVLRSQISSVRVVKGIWPYADPGRLVAARLGMDTARTAITQLGGNGVYDVVNETAASVQAGELDAALICGAETMRTRRKDKSEGRRSSYLTEREDARPDLVLGSTRDLVDQSDIDAEAFHPVNFYAMAESAIRHRNGESRATHRDRIAAMWARGSAVAADNSHAWLRSRTSAEDIAMVGPANRMVASPYTKLMTSNINVDQAAALVICSLATAQAAGMRDDQVVFLHAGSGASDAWLMRQRLELDRSPAIRLAGTRVLELARTSIDEIDHLDLYSCFPAAVQVAQTELAIDADRPFTTTGGLTFAGGPYNGYCTQALAHTTNMIAGTNESALLTGNGGFFTKHSFCVVSGRPPDGRFRYERPQSEVDSVGSRAIAPTSPSAGTIEAYTVTHDRAGEPERGILAVIDADETRSWAKIEEPSAVLALLDDDLVGSRVDLRQSQPLTASLAS